MSTTQPEGGYHGDVPQSEPDPEVSKAFGRAVRVARAPTGASRAQLARAAGIDLSLMGRIERGQRDPRLSAVVRLAAALGLRPWQLVKFMDEGEQTMTRTPTATARTGARDALADALAGEHGDGSASRP